MGEVVVAVDVDVVVVAAWDCLMRAFFPCGLELDCPNLAASWAFLGWEVFGYDDIGVKTLQKLLPKVLGAVTQNKRIWEPEHHDYHGF